MQLFKYNDAGAWYVRFRMNGKLIVRSTKTTNRQLAERFGDKLRNGMLEDSMSRDGKEPITLKDGLELFLQSKEGTPNHHNLSYQIKFIIENFNPQMPFSDVKTAWVEKLAQKRKEKASAATVLHTVTCLRSAHKYLTRLGYHTAAVEFPTVKVRNQRQRYLSAEEEKKFLDALSPDRTWEKMATDLTDYQKEGLQKNFDLGIALLDTGGRLNEVVRLEWRHVNLQDKTVMLWRTKTNSGTTLAMSDRLYETLKRRFDTRKQDKWVFPGAGDQPAVSSAARVRKALKRAGLEGVRLHDLRHTLASKLIQNGLSLYEVASVLGHSSPNTSARYAHLEKRDVANKAAAVMNKLNGG